MMDNRSDLYSREPALGKGDTSALLLDSEIPMGGGMTDMVFSGRGTLNGSGTHLKGSLNSRGPQTEQGPSRRFSDVCISVLLED
jgi:hypothetical protein